MALCRSIDEAPHECICIDDGLVDASERRERRQRLFHVLDLMEAQSSNALVKDDIATAVSSASKEDPGSFNSSGSKELDATQDIAIAVPQLAVSPTSSGALLLSGPDFEDLDDTKSEEDSCIQRASSLLATEEVRYMLQKKTANAVGAVAVIGIGVALVTFSLALVLHLKDS
jgi:hypothetical protein